MTVNINRILLHYVLKLLISLISSERVSVAIIRPIRF